MRTMKQDSVYKTFVSEIIRLTRQIVSRYGPRIPGTAACLDTAGYLKEQFEKVCHRAYLQEYDQHPGAFYNINRILALTYAAASIMYLFQGKCFYASALLLSLGMVYFVSQFLFLGTLFDRLFPKAPGCNVVGMAEPLTEVRQQIILSGHHDSTYICNFLERHQKWYSFRLILPILFFLYAWTASVLSSLFEILEFRPSVFLAVCTGIICGGNVFVIPLYFYHNRKGAPGAGDNLLSSVLCLQVPQVLKRIDEPLLHTRLVLLSTDGEEIGQKGAKAFIKHYREEMEKIKTYVFNIDSIYTLEDLTLLRSELNGTVRLSRRLLEEVRELAGQSGFSLRMENLPPGGGGTDAGQFARIGVDAVSLIGLSTSLIRTGLHYHTSSDLVENIEPQAIEAALQIAIRFILKKEKEMQIEEKTR